MSSPQPIYLIESHHRNRDEGHHLTQVTLLDEEGFFLDRAQAQARAEQLNDNPRRAHAADEARRLREKASRAAEVEQANAEAAVLRAAGFNKPDTPMPAPFKPTTFEDWAKNQYSLTTYQVIRLMPSEHEVRKPGN